MKIKMPKEQFEAILKEEIAKFIEEKTDIHLGPEDGSGSSMPGIDPEGGASNDFHQIPPEDLNRLPEDEEEGTDEEV